MLHRTGLKTALSVRSNTCNEIIYVETGTFPLSCDIKKGQYNFWKNLTDNIENDSPLNTLISKARDINLPYIKYYDNLLQNYTSADQIRNIMKAEFSNKWKDKINKAHSDDPLSKLGTYADINSNFKPVVFKPTLFELDRILITRYRTGSNNLLIETGRFSNPRIPRESRICRCGNGVQTLKHVIMDCTIVLQSARVYGLEHNFDHLNEFFNWSKCQDFLIRMTKALKIEI